MAKKRKLKALAQASVPQTRDEAAAAIREIGDTQREFWRRSSEMNDSLAEITGAHQPVLEALKIKIESLQSGVQAYCEAHRDDLTGGKVKTVNLITGEIAWRLRPPSVTVRGAESVIETLERLGLAKFVRTKREVNKEAILNEPDEVKGVAGITIVTGVEDFVITPFEQDPA